MLAIDPLVSAPRIRHKRSTTGNILLCEAMENLLGIAGSAPDAFNGRTIGAVER